MEPLGRGRAEARSRLSVQRRVQRCCARLSSRPAPRSAVPTAPSTDTQLSPQGNMASLRGSGRSKRRKRRSCGAQCSPVLSGKDPGAWGPKLRFTRGFALQAEGQRRIAVDYAPLGNVPLERPASSGLVPESDGSRAKMPPPCGGAGCLRTARAEHLPPPWVSTPSMEAAREGKERSNSPVCQPGLRSPGLCRPPPTSLFSSLLTLFGLPRQHLYRYWIAPCGLIPIHTT